MQIVFSGMDDMSYMARSQDKGITPLKNPKKGKHYVEGALAISPEDWLKDSISDLEALLRLINDKKGVVLTPLPRFVSGKCCDKPNHLTNLGPKDRAKTLLELADRARD